MLENEPNVVPMWLVGWIVTGASSLILGLTTALWRRHNADIQALHERLDNTVTLEMYEQNRREMREDMNGLHRKMENIDLRAQARHDAVMERLSDSNR